MAAERPKVLIVDDQPRNLDALEAMLAPSECVLVRAHSADEALLALLRHEFAAIVLDIRMPGMTGIELAGLIKERKRTQHIPILFLTAHSADDSEILRGYGVGAVDYLSKPVNPEVLRSKIGVFIELFRKTRALADVNEVLQREVGERERAQAALQRANQELEARVEERTRALTRAHQGVLENAERLGMAMDVAQMTAWEWQLSSGTMTWASDPEALFGFPTGAFGPERRIVRVLHAEDRDRVERCMGEALQSGAYDCEYRVVRPDGSIVWITERGRVVPGEPGQGDRMVGITRDVTAEREAAREREELLRHAREARDEAELQVRLKDDFLATLSHELRTPMNAVLGWLAILQQDDTLPDEARNTLGIIERNATIQAKLIEDLLDMTRLMTGNIQLEMGVVDLAAVLEMTVQAIRPTAQAKQVAIALEQDVAASTVVGDARRLQQVFWNLVHNGVKFTPSGGRVEVRVQDAAGTLAVGVTDTGRGITPAFLPHVFERFRQEDASTTRESFGLGLGLSIARHLVELHGGTIEALSGGPGTGATFRVLLPALPATAAGAARPGKRSVAAS
jgi:signal transduction histidine kinase/CheY-like chemotaxis protein